jgi:anti-sigma-K factor RskA
MDCQEFEALSGAYVLDAITDDERREAEAHLAQCPNCPRKLRELQAVVNLLPLSLPPVEPPPDLKARLFAAIHAEAPPKTIMLPQRAPRRTWWQYWETRLVVGVAALLCILLGGTLAWNASLQQQIALQEQTAPTSIAYTLHSSSGDTSTTGELIYFPQMHLVTLVMHGLPSPQGTQIYQGWFLKNNNPKSIGVLRLQGNTAILDYSGDVTGYNMVAVSIEPGPEASPAKPKGEIIAAGSLSGSH